MKETLRGRVSTDNIATANAAGAANTAAADAEDTVEYESWRYKGSGEMVTKNQIGPLASVYRVPLEIRPWLFRLVIVMGKDKDLQIVSNIIRLAELLSHYQDEQFLGNF